MNYTDEFKDYAIKHLGVSSLEYYQWEKLQEEKAKRKRQRGK